jgi:hypothetical protein
MFLIGICCTKIDFICVFGRFLAVTLTTGQPGSSLTPEIKIKFNEHFT